MTQNEMTFQLPVTTLLELFAQEGVFEPRQGDKLQVQVQIKQITPNGVVIAMAGTQRLFDLNNSKKIDHTTEGENLRSAALWTDKSSNEA